MQKILGSAIVLAASTAIGYEKGRELDAHVNELETLKYIFTILRKEMLSTKMIIPELLLKISNKVDGSFREWMCELGRGLQMREQKTLEEIWDESIEKWFGKSKLTKSEKEELYQVGRCLGYVEGIELYLDQLEIFIKKNREEAANKKKMYQSIGVLGGLFLVIVLF